MTPVHSRTYDNLSFFNVIIGMAVIIVMIRITRFSSVIYTSLNLIVLRAAVFEGAQGFI